MSDVHKPPLRLPIQKRARLATLLAREGREEMLEEGIPRRAGTGPVPPSFAQQRMWFLDRLAPGLAAYNIPRALRIRGPLNRDALQQALDGLVARHETLRTTFSLTGDAPVQVIAPEATVALEFTDLTEGSESEREGEARRRLSEIANRPFDLSRDLMLRAALVRLGPNDHALLLVMHHIAGDGWSLGVLARDLGALYGAFLEGRPSPLAEPPIQYADYAVWQRQWLQGEELERQISYWRERLTGAPASLDFPGDHPRPSVQTFRGGHESFEVPAAVAQALRTLGQGETCTPFMTFLACFQVFLGRHTGQDDLTVGVPIAGRNRMETEELIGFFVNTLVMRADLSGNPTFRQLLRRARDTALGAYAHQDLPFEKLVEELHPDRSLSHSPLFQVAFQIQHAAGDGLRLPGLEVKPFSLGNTTAKFDLSLALTEGRALWGGLTYNADLFEAETAVRLLERYQTLLESIAANPDTPIRNLVLLPEAERNSLLVDWNQTPAPCPRERCVPALVEEQAARAPGALAVASAAERLSYAELNARANQWAHFLRRRGAGPETLVGICAERSVEMIVGLLAILKAGAAYVPVDPAYPKERIATMLEDAGASVLLTQRRLLADLPETDCEVVCLDAGGEQVAGESRENPPCAVSAANLAYVVYTSGSTGKPKGVEIEHGSLLNLVAWHRRAYAVTPEDRATQVAGPAFDASVWEIWPYLTAGASLHIPDEETRAFPARLLSWLCSERITLSFLPTPLAEAVLALIEEDIPETMALRALLTGGDRLHQGPQRPLPFDLVNHYGPTENTVVSTAIKVEPGVWHEAPPPIGRPIDNTAAYILDAFLQPVPIGVPGELHVAGAGLARGYRNRPDLTEERFISWTTSQAGDGSTPAPVRLYKTGDLTRFLPDGNIEFLGRIDHQVKVRGFRIELGEIEAVIRQHSGVQDGAVLAREDTPGDVRLVAYVVPRGEEAAAPGAGTTLSTDEMRAHLAAKLPAYMVPAAFVVLDKLPLTPNGKVDRRALPAPSEERAVGGSDYEAPRSELERSLVELWERVLGVKPIGVRDNFFALGGHSLLAVRLFAQMEKVVGRQLPLSALFATPTIAQLAASLQGEQQLEAARPWLIEIQPQGSKPPFFCVQGGDKEADLLAFRPLVECLGTDQPFFALRSPWAGEEGLRGYLPELAATHIATMRTRQPHGPYFLGGYCFGGLVAFEMANQLRAQGEEVPFVALFDTRAPGYRLSAAEKESYKRTLKTRLWEPIRLMRRNIAMVATQLWIRSGAPLPAALQAYHQRQKGREAGRRYVPQPYGGRVLLFRPDNPASDPRWGWDRFITGTLDLHVIPSQGALECMIGPGVPILTKILIEYLEGKRGS